ncbi:ACTIN PATCHES DISTAL PROTEIN 1 [Ceraceosorus bombacis]|uniref:ACTIN PATCHES DISTAL PROTEIN 1 n=1 Tax=Ceraceosorus bombacis TaxID=401625 RepID=A0A0P1BK47_9BASI|nr:ACTIN PATCHES DISTAL PROTEIN 1 [Ceraceosorus bombacis]
MTNEMVPNFKSSVARIPELDERAAQAFRAAGIPLSDCLSCCASNCHPAAASSGSSAKDVAADESEESDIAPKLLKAWSKQSIDKTSDMLGSNKPFASHLLVSTNKKDWTHDAAEEEEGKGVLGLLSRCNWTLREQQEWRDLRIKSQRWVMPFRAVVLLCSHKKRDVRCSLAAEMLGQHFQTLAEEKGWKVDMRADEVGLGGGGGRRAEEEMRETVLLATDGLREDRGWGYVDETLGEQQQEEQVRAWKRRAAKGDDELPGRSALGKQERDDDGTGTLGLFFCSHIGGHKFSGNVIIYFPNGAGVWYGRIDPTTLKDARLVFEETIERGNVVGRFLRGGMNLVRQRDDDEQEEQMHSDRGQRQSNDGATATLTGPCAKGAGILAW